MCYGKKKNCRRQANRGEIHTSLYASRHGYVESLIVWDRGSGVSNPLLSSSSPKPQPKISLYVGMIEWFPNMAEGEIVSPISDATKTGGISITADYENGGSFAKENGWFDGSQCATAILDQLVQMVFEANFQNEYLKSHLEGLKILHVDASESNGSEDAKGLHEKIEYLNRQLLEEKQTRGAAEEALKHLRAAYSDADAKAQGLSFKLAEGQIDVIWSINCLSRFLLFHDILFDNKIMYCNDSS